MPDNAELENPDLQRAFAKEGLASGNDNDESGALYRMIGSEKIPVSKKLGRVWESRINQAKARRKTTEVNWIEAIRYYENDQSSGRNGGRLNQSGTTQSTRQTEDWTETENVVFSNATTMLPMLYAKNPQVEVTAINTANENYAKTAEKLINKLLVMRTTPGLNPKYKVRRAILWALLTNNAWMKVGFTAKQDSNQQAIDELKRLTRELENASSAHEIREVEGKLQALEEKIALLSPSGPSLKLCSPFDIYSDTTSTEPDNSDANWVAERDYLPTAYLNAVFAKEQDEQYRSVYEPTHILNASDSDKGGLQDEINNFTLIDQRTDAEKTADSYGYKSKAAFDRAQYTECYWIWDKTTRRLYLFAANKWEWPLWVWNNPLGLLEFYPYDHLWFHEQVEGNTPKGEVTYYLDQQDAINDTNATIARARSWAKNNIWYDKNAISQQEVEDVLKGADGTARGIDLKDGQSLKDVIQSFVPPALAYPDLLNNDRYMQTINRITGISDAQRGAQFKTNTTNDAVDFYQQNIDVRRDEKIDLIEDWFGSICWKVFQLVATRFTKDDVRDILGDDDAANWQTFGSTEELRKKFYLQVVGGSTEKPTSRNKQNTVLKIGQALGQFGNGVPALAMILLKMFERAFNDDVNITDDDWAMLHQSMNQAANAAGAGPGGQGQGQLPPEVQQQLSQMIQSLPPEKKQELEQLVQKGVSPSDALKQVMQSGQQLQQQAK